MQLHVLRQVALLREHLPTLPAPVRLLTSVHFEVVEDVPCFGKLFSAPVVVACQQLVHALGGWVVHVLDSALVALQSLKNGHVRGGRRIDAHSAHPLDLGIHLGRAIDDRVVFVEGVDAFSDSL